MTMFARQFAARAVASLILGSLLVGSGVIGYQAIGKGSHPGRTAAQPPGEASGPRKRMGKTHRQTAVHRLESVKNLRQLGLAIMAFEQANGFLPPPAIRDPNTGKPLLSWRVAILPWIGCAGAVPAVSPQRSLGQPAQQDPAGEDAGRTMLRWA